MIDHTGQRFGRLVVIGRIVREGDANIYWHCRCDCGKESTPRGYSLRSGHTLSCGCLLSIYRTNRRRRSSRKKLDPLYLVWCAMRERCLRSRVPAYANYGGRGITICKEWQNYETFRVWALAHGWRQGLHINRVDNNGGYRPDNCNFVTAKENNNNRRNNRFLTWQGRTLTIAQWAGETGIHRRTLNNRIGHGWSVERALTEPTRDWTAK